MFTGIIEEVGEIDEIKSIAGGKSLKISSKEILRDLKVGDSISVNGVCLTVTNCTLTHFHVDAVGETMSKTTISMFKVGRIVNLERALQLSQRLGGHLVQGHVNGVGEIFEIKKLGENYSLSVIVPGILEKYFIKEGSVAIDGVSLTIAQTLNNKLTFSIIPHTWKNTNLRLRKVGDKVNVEIDVIAKYVEKFLINIKENRGELNEEWLNKLGY